jgi:hypothetical protein
MADEPQTVRGIDWKATFPFTQIFRSFRIAIHPSKLVLALLALVLIWLGGNILDGIWPNNSRAIFGEIDLYEQVQFDGRGQRDFVAQRNAVRDAAQERYKSFLKTMVEKPDGNLADIRWRIEHERDKEVDRLRQNFSTASTQPNADRKQLEKTRDEQIAATYDQAEELWAQFRDVNGRGLFTTLAQYQVGKLYLIISRAGEGNWLGDGGAVDCLFDFFTIGPTWALRYHYVFFTIFVVYFLVIWAIFGGAISRIAAVQVARDEKISFRQALSFATAKFLSFVSAPIIPLLIVVAVGVVIGVCALLTNIPFLGPIVVGAFFFLALAAGFVMTLVLIGLIGGFNLMYPTIAVEGSDSFDAISRSFSYLYARPWRLAFYTLVAAAYGAITYIFVRYFLKMILSLTHYFVGMGVLRDADDTRPLWTTIWPDPLVAARLSFTPDYLTLAGGQDIGAFLIWFWVALCVAMLGAFAISFYFSANTIIYVLMRHEVDATELDDVYLEQTEEDFGDLPSAPPPAASPAPETPAAPPPST